MRLRVRLLVACGLMLGVVAPGSASAQAAGQQTFVRVLQGRLGDHQPSLSTVVATGVVNARGIERFGRDIPGDPSSYQTLVFRQGTIRTRTFDEEVDFSIDPRTCVGRLTVTGQEEIIGGTGAFRGASGSGTVTERGWVVAGRNPDGTCNENDLSYTIVVRYQGTLELPTALAA